jgi:hypothetical protein
MAVAVVTPMVEVVVVIAEALNIGVKLIDASKRAGFARMDGVGGAAAGTSPSPSRTVTIVVSPASLTLIL